MRRGVPGLFFLSLWKARGPSSRAMASRRWVARATPSMRPRRARESSARRDAVFTRIARESTRLARAGLATLVSHAGMEMTSYPVLVEVQSEMARMKVIYDLYRAFEKFRKTCLKQVGENLMLKC